MAQGRERPPLPVAEAEREGVYKWLVLLTVSIGTFMTTMDSSIVNISLPVLARVFDVGPSIVLWVALIYILISTGLMLTAGGLADRIGRKRVYTYGFVLFSVGLALCALSQNLLQLVLFRVVQAIGAAMTIGMGTAIVTASFSPRERGRALGILVAVVGGGLFSGPAIGGFLMDLIDWRAIFYLRLPLGLIGSVMAWSVLKGKTTPSLGEGFDFWGSLTLFGGLASLLLGVNQGQVRGWTSPFVLGVLVSAAVLISLFLALERRAAHPIVDLSLFRNRVFAAGNASLFVSFVARITPTFLMPFYLIQALGYSPTKAGLFVMVVPLTMLAASPLSGWLSDKLGSRLLCSSGLALICLGLFLLSRLTLNSTAVDVSLGLLVLGLGSGVFESPNMSSIMGAAPRKRLGTASALLGTIRGVGMSTGMALAGAIFASRQLLYLAQGSEESQALVWGMRDALTAALIIGSLGVFVSLIWMKQKDAP